MSKFTKVLAGISIVLFASVALHAGCCKGDQKKAAATATKSCPLSKSSCEGKDAAKCDMKDKENCKLKDGSCKTKKSCSSKSSCSMKKDK